MKEFKLTTLDVRSSYETGPYLCSLEEDLSLREMVDNYRNGYPINARVFEDSGLGTDDDNDDGTDFDYINFDSLDLVEIQELRTALNERASKLRKIAKEANDTTYREATAKVPTGLDDSQGKQSEAKPSRSDES